MNPLFVVVIVLLSIIGGLFYALMWLADRLDAARRKRGPVMVIGPALPVAQLHRPTAWRRKFQRPTTNQRKNET